MVQRIQRRSNYMSGKKEKQKRKVGSLLKEELRKNVETMALIRWKYKLTFFEKLSWGFSKRKYIQATLDYYVNKSSKWRKL